MLTLFAWLASLAAGLAADGASPAPAPAPAPRAIPEEDLTAKIRRQSLARQRATIANLRESERHLVGILSEPEAREDPRLREVNVRALQRVQDLRRRVERQITENEARQVH